MSSNCLGNELLTRKEESKGRISIINMSYPAELQAKLLQDEGVKVEMKDGSYYVNLAQYLWRI